MLSWPRPSSAPNHETCALTRLEAQAERIASALPPLLVDAERLAASVAPGIHGRRRVGPGESFWQFRPYMQGDPVQSIDWRQTAKSRHAAVRELEWEAAQTVFLWRNGGPTMRFQSKTAQISKQDRASILLLALASLLARAGEQVALAGGHHPPGAGRANLDMLSDELSVLPTEDGLPSPEFIPPRDSTLVLLGDFLTPASGMAARFSPLADQGVDGHLMLILDPAEWHFPYRGRVQFHSLAGEDALMVPRADGIQTAYRERISAHVEDLRQMTATLGWRFHLHITDKAAEAALAALIGGIAPKTMGGGR